MSEHTLNSIANEMYGEGVKLVLVLEEQVKLDRIREIVSRPLEVNHADGTAAFSLMCERVQLIHDIIEGERNA